MRGALNRVVEQGQQLGSERLYLLFGLSAGFGCVWGKLAAEPSDLGRKLVVLSREDCYLLLGNPRTGLGLVPLLLPELCPVAPEAGSSALSSVTHRRASEAMNPRATATTGAVHHELD